MLSLAAFVLVASAAGSVPDYPAPLGEALAKATSGRACSDADRAKVVLSPEMAYWLGRAATERMLEHYAQPNRVPVIFEPDTVAATYLAQIGFTLVEATSSAEHPSTAESPLRGFHFMLVRDPVPNAWSFPGGFVVLTDGLLMRASSEEQVAGLLAHELAHLRDGHVSNLWREALCRQRGKKEKGAEVQADLLIGLALKAVADTGLGPTLEAEADAEATRNLELAGYSAMGLADYLSHTEHDSLNAGVAKRHPPSGDRTKAIADQLEAEKLTAAAHSPHEHDRDVRFMQVMVESGLRPDWKPVLDFYRR